MLDGEANDDMGSWKGKLMLTLAAGRGIEANADMGSWKGELMWPKTGKLFIVLNKLLQ